MKSIQIYLILLFGITNLSLSQWQGDTRLTNNPAGSFTPYNNARAVASSGNLVHIVWQDYRDGESEIYYKRSTDEGLSWGVDTRITNNFGESNYPSIAISGSTLHVAWWDTRITSNSEIYYKRSTDMGITWGADIRLTNDPSFSMQHCLSVSGQNVHIVWIDRREGNDEVYYKRSTDAGISWGADIRLTNNSQISSSPSVSSSGATVHVVWDDYRDVWPEIYYKRSTDNGTSWGADIRVSVDDNYDSFFASSSVSGTDVHIAWIDLRSLNHEIYYNHSTNGGTTWGTDTRLTNSPGYSMYPSIFASGQGINIVWDDERDSIGGNHEIYNKRSTDGGISWGTDVRLTNNPATSENASVSISGSVAHLIWRDNRHGNTNYEIYYKRDPNGNPNAINTISTEVPNGFSLSQNYPNPFNPVTNINFSIPKSGYVKLTVFDILGREAAILVNENLTTGTYKVDFDASGLSSGVYFYKLETDVFIDVKKLILIK